MLIPLRKISLKNKSSIIIASVLLSTFFLLHYYVYIDTTWSIPIIVSETEPPISGATELRLCDEKKPSYFNPFRKVQYSYNVFSNGNYTDCNIIEEATSIFSSKMHLIAYDLQDYFTSNQNGDDLFLRQYAIPNEYANLNFFIFQYFIIACFTYVLFKPEKSK